MQGGSPGKHRVQVAGTAGAFVAEAPGLSPSVVGAECWARAVYSLVQSHLLAPCGHRGEHPVLPRGPPGFVET